MNEPPPNDPKATALAIVQTLVQAGFQTFWAGGCVRDMLMGRPPKDFDIATGATPDQVAALFPKTLDVGKSFGVMQVVADGRPFEVATFRRDISYADGRRPDSVQFSQPEEDARRRDFTINGLFYDPVADQVIDYVEGRKDLAARVVRAIGDPESRFREDHLRMLRAVRFSAVLGFEIEGRTRKAIRDLAPLLASVSAERIRDELVRLLTEAPKPGQGLVLLREVGLLAVVLPEVDAMAGQEQPPEFHPEGDVFTHTAGMLDRMEHPTPVLALAVLLHDVGKPPTAKRVAGPGGKERIRFDGHASAGAETAQRILQRLRMPLRDIEAVVHCIRNHMRFMDVQKMRRSTLRRLVGAPTFPAELELHRVDCLCSHGDLGNYEFLQTFVRELRDEPALPAPWVTGDDLLALGIPEGPRVGRWLKKAYEAQLEGRFGERETLLAWVKESLAEVDCEP